MILGFNFLETELGIVSQNNYLQDQHRKRIYSVTECHLAWNVGNEQTHPRSFIIIDCFIYIQWEEEKSD